MGCLSSRSTTILQEAQVQPKRLEVPHPGGGMVGLVRSQHLIPEKAVESLSFHAWQWRNPNVREDLVHQSQDQGTVLWALMNAPQSHHHLPLTGITSETIFVHQTTMIMATF